jgi:hypothetical protein
MSQAAPGYALLPPTAITTAVAAGLSNVLLTGNVVDAMTLQLSFVYGSGGTSADAYVQTSLDGGVTWIDIANSHFTTSSAVKLYTLVFNTVNTTALTPTDGSLTANTAVSGVFGDRFRVKYVTVGTYAATTLGVVAFLNDAGAN